MSKIWPVTIVEFQDLIEVAQKNHSQYNEPIPELSHDNIQKLESCLATPFQTFDGHLLYKGFINKAAILFYLLIKNHPLNNGNKRMAILTLAWFCEKNNRSFKWSDETFYNMAKSTAESNDKDRAVNEIKRLLKMLYKKK